MSLPKKPTKKLTPKQFARAQLDLFGEVPVTRPDVYAWLLAVVDMDPENGRAEAYVRNYRVLDKIVTAKLNGRMRPNRGSGRARRSSMPSESSNFEEALSACSQMVRQST